MKDKFLNEAIRIGDELLALAETDEHGLFWRTMDLQNGRVVWSAGTDLYRGVSGIALFLLELYCQAAVPTYLQTGRAAMDWVIHQCQVETKNSHAFLSGRLGVAYALLRFFAVTGESSYREQAVALVKSGLDVQQDTLNEYINGRAGTLLGLLHLHAATGEAWALTAVSDLIAQIMAEAHYGLQGLYWDRNENQITGLCGLSHGVAGIGLALLEAGHYLQNEPLCWLAEQAFLYEAFHYDPGHNNWPDFRHLLYPQTNLDKNIALYQAGETETFYQSKYDMNWWCHGASGIGLSRLRAFNLRPSANYQQEILLTTQKVVHDLQVTLQSETLNDFCLCHGICGNADILLTAYQILEENSCLVIAQQVGERVLRHKQNRGIYPSGFLGYGGDSEDYGLFLGNAGIGYFFLRLADPTAVPSMLWPGLEGQIEQADSLLDNPYRQVITRGFERALTVLETAVPHQVAAHLQTQPGDYGEEFEHFVLGLAEEAIWPQINDIFTLEQAKIRLDLAQASHALLFVQEKAQTKQAKTLLASQESDLRQAHLQTNPDIEIISTEWNWNLETPEKWIDNLSLAPKMFPLLLKPTPQGIVEISLNPFAHQILMLFGEGAAVADVVSIIVTHLGQAAVAETITTQVLTQIRQLLTTNLLYFPPTK